MSAQQPGVQLTSMFVFSSRRDINPFHCYANNVDAFLRRAVRCGYNSQLTLLSDLLHATEMTSSAHCAYQLLPPVEVKPKMIIICCP